METKFLPIVPDGVSDEDFNSRFSGQNPNGMENGRLNMLNLINARQTVNQLHWTDVLGVVTDVDHQLNSGYESIWYACLLRNRDLDGDDVIDADEIRWYLASVDQLTDLWIGETAIPKAKLYMNDIDASGVEIPMKMEKHVYMWQVVVIILVQQISLQINLVIHGLYGQRKVHREDLRLIHRQHLVNTLLVLRISLIVV